MSLLIEVLIVVLGVGLEIFFLILGGRGGKLLPSFFLSSIIFLDNGDKIFFGRLVLSLNLFIDGGA
jgi:hypothetical protein